MQREKQDSGPRKMGTDRACPTKSFLRRVRTAIQESRAFQDVGRILVGVSGGVDSAVLMHVLHEIVRKENIQMVAAHVHHGVRAEEAERDAAMAERVARKYGTEFHVLRPVAERKEAAEHELRNLRLQALNALAQELGADRVVLGHHQDDQAETFLLRLLQGTDLRGLGGIRVFRPPLWVHPMLSLSRQEILEEAERCGIPFVEDSTNQQTYPRRNFLRANTIPMLEAHFNPQLRRNLNALARSIGSATDFLEKQARDLLVSARSGAHIYEVDPLRRAHVYLRSVALQLSYRLVAGDETALRRRQLEALEHLVQTNGELRSFALPQNVVVIREGSTLKLARND